ncbi:SPASM domain-containing protein [Clostridium botulinum C]|uniref:PapB family radical SAM/SPASM ranthipeptide maturase n=1 Tax=Clostridium botulinum TaxID=1491 RepID=UPI001E4EF1AB|nr:radical SAM protein [Clostridium botulinum]MCD3246641.1 SPASM domain-containing protein [Clostridium botulinum C]MCD3262950.1 SPASM domain-containing protein [Clostridium botulinum C]
MENNTLNFTPYKLINQNNKSFIFISENNLIYEVDDKIINILSKEGKNYIDAYNELKDSFNNKKEFLNLIKNLEDNEFILKNKKDNKIILNKEDIGSLKSLTLMLVQGCNMGCSYCFGDSGEYNNKGEMSFNTAKDAIDFLVNNSPNKEKNLQITFFGGEPLLKIDLIKQIVNYCKKIEKKSNKKFEFSMTTNGTLLNEEIEKYLIDNNVFIQLSIDGDKETHDKNRYFKSKLGSYDLIIKNTDNLRKNNLISARATITKYNLGLVEIFNHLDQLGFSFVAMAPAHNLLSEDDYEVLKKETSRLIHYFEFLIKNNQINKASRIKFQWDDLNKIHSGYKRLMPCGVGRNMVAVDINGELYPCHRFVGCDEFKIGTIVEKTINNINFINSINVLNQSKCNKCWIKNLCIGGCPHESYSITGKIGGYNKQYCELNLNKFELMLQVYLRLTDKEKEKIFKKL